MAVNWLTYSPLVILDVNVPNDQPTSPACTLCSVTYWPTSLYMHLLTHWPTNFITLSLPYHLSNQPTSCPPINQPTNFAVLLIVTHWLPSLLSNQSTYQPPYWPTCWLLASLTYQPTYWLPSLLSNQPTNQLAALPTNLPSIVLTAFQSPADILLTTNQLTSSLAYTPTYSVSTVLLT